MWLREAYQKARLGQTLRIEPSGKQFVKECGYFTEDVPGYNPGEDALRGYALLTREELDSCTWSIVDEWFELGIDPSL